MLIYILFALGAVIVLTAPLAFGIDCLNVHHAQTIAKVRAASTAARALIGVAAMAVAILLNGSAC